MPAKSGPCLIRRCPREHPSLERTAEGKEIEVGLTMSERKAVTRQVLERYQAASKGEKTTILDELCSITGWNRDHARKALRQAARTPQPRKKPNRSRTYGHDVLVPLRKIWATLDAPSGKRLAPFLPEIVEVMERCGELRLSPEIRAKLLRVSAATIDRLLAGDRRRLQIKGRSGTKPGSLLKRQIPIRTFAEWDEARPGFLEIDLVSHDGGHPHGSFCHTLTLTDVATGWTEVRAVPNKAQRWVHEALIDVAIDLPFLLLGLDSDNGSEFINNHLFAWCSEQEITFTRSRPFRKNDNCYVEQKNWTVVRQAVGYLRYETPDHLAILAELYRSLTPYVNFFQPQMKLTEKTRTGAKVSRHYDRAQTPYRRLLAAGVLRDEVLTSLKETYDGLNPTELKKQIAALQSKLLHSARRLGRPPYNNAGPDHPWRASYRDDGLRASLVRQRTSRSRAI
jgi:hypothetical protein